MVAPTCPMKNELRQGFWNVAADVGLYRLINQTAECQGLPLLVTTVPLAPTRHLTPVPSHLIGDHGCVKVMVSKGTLVPIGRSQPCAASDEATAVTEPPPLEVPPLPAATKTMGQGLTMVHREARAPAPTTAAGAAGTYRVAHVAAESVGEDGLLPQLPQLSASAQMTLSGPCPFPARPSSGIDGATARAADVVSKRRRSGELGASDAYLSSAAQSSSAMGTTTGCSTVHTTVHTTMLESASPCWSSNHGSSSVSASGSPPADSSSPTGDEFNAFNVVTSGGGAALGSLMGSLPNELRELQATLCKARELTSRVIASSCQGGVELSAKQRSDLEEYRGQYDRQLLQLMGWSSFPPPSTTTATSDSALLTTASQHQHAASHHQLRQLAQRQLPTPFVATTVLGAAPPPLPTFMTNVTAGCTGLLNDQISRVARTQLDASWQPQPLPLQTTSSMMTIPQAFPMPPNIGSGTGLGGCARATTASASSQAACGMTGQDMLQDLMQTGAQMQTSTAGGNDAWRPPFMMPPSLPPSPPVTSATPHSSVSSSAPGTILTSLMPWLPQWWLLTALLFAFLLTNECLASETKSMPGHVASVGFGFLALIWLFPASLKQRRRLMSSLWIFGIIAVPLIFIVDDLQRTPQEIAERMTILPAIAPFSAIAHALVGSLHSSLPLGVSSGRLEKVVAMESLVFALRGLLLCAITGQLFLPMLGAALAVVPTQFVFHLCRETNVPALVALAAV